jgi:hypothetical protein
LHPAHPRRQVLDRRNLEMPRRGFGKRGHNQLS